MNYFDRFSGQKGFLHGLENAIDNIGTGALGKAETLDNGLGQLFSGQVC